MTKTLVSIMLGLFMAGLSGNVWAGSVVAADLNCTNPAGCVQTNEISDGAVTEAKIAPTAVTTDKIAIGAVTDAQITGPISASKLAKPSNVVVVAKSGGDFTSIQAALNSINPTADNPYHIKVMPGVYSEHVSIGSNIYLDGTDSSLTTITASGDFVISTNSVSNVVVTNFTIKCDQSSGINTRYSSISIVGNKFTGCGDGIYNDHSNATVIENSITGGGNGIDVFGGSLIIKRNTISGNGNGITRSYEMTDYIDIEENTISANGTGINLAAHRADIVRNSITSNQTDIFIQWFSCSYNCPINNIRFNVYDNIYDGMAARYSYNIKSDGTPW